MCGELYDLEIIKEGIEDGPSNTTRFLLVSRKPYDHEGEKTSLIFAVAHEAGMLSKVLNLFAEADINLTRIASMPLRSDPSNYCFFLDFEGSDREQRIADVLNYMGELTISLKNLGSYPTDRSVA